MYIIVGRSNYDLGNKIVKLLNENGFGQNLSVIINNFANTEINVELKESVRGQDVCIIETGSKFGENSINDSLIETLILIDACKRSSAKSITIIMPCFPYARSDKKDHRGGINSKLVCDILTTAGATRIVAVDLHSSQIQGFANIPFDNLYAIKDISQYLINNIFKVYGKQNCILVSPDAGGIKRIKAYSELLDMNNVILNKFRDYSTNNKIDKSMLIGEPHMIENKIAIMIDDMIDTAGTMIKGAEELLKYGAKSVILIATHGILSNPAIEKINNTDYISHVIVTNSIDQTENVKLTPKINVVDISHLIATIIQYISTGGSISSMFDMNYMKSMMPLLENN